MALETAAVAGASLYSYNRENFMYDRKMRQETEYNVMDFRLKQAELYRDDVRELIELTSVKMDTYLIVITIELGFGVMALCEGRMKIGTPRWLVGAYILSLASCFMYLLMAIWFAVRASVTSKMYKLRLLTQHVRLPMPSWASLEGARTYASSFEGLHNKQMFRVPFAMGSQQDLVEPTAPSTQGCGSQCAEAQTEQSADCWGLEGRGDHIYELDARNWTSPEKLQHLSYVRKAVPQWQSYDGFARAAMTVGTINLVHALAYYVLGYVLLDTHCVFSAWFVVVVLMAIVIQLIEMDMSLDRFEFGVAVLLVVSGPAIEGFACERHVVNGYADSSTVLFVTPIACLAHALYNIFLLFICKVDEQTCQISGQVTYLPIGFRSVMYVDVFGWIRRSLQARTSARDVLTGPSSEALSFSMSAAAAKQDKQDASHGPAFGAIRYELGNPVRSRPEELPGAAAAIDHDNLRDEHLDNASFVPPEKYDEGQGSTAEDNPGKTPWRIFSGTTLLLAILWLLVGAGLLMESLGFKFFVVQELLEAPEDESEDIEEGEAVSAFQNKLHGIPIMTDWPRGAGKPHSLTCGADYAGERDWFVASSEFRMFAAQMPTNLSNVDSKLSFEATPSCTRIQDKAIQDVSLYCDPSGSCTLLVLPKHAKHVVGCGLSSSDTMNKASASSLSFKHHTDSIGDASSAVVVRLGERSAALENEEVISLATTGQCNVEIGSGNGNTTTCAYVATQSGRVFEMRAGEYMSSNELNVLSWLPVRSLRLDGVGSRDSYHKSNSLVLMSNRLLVLLPSDGLVKVVETVSQARGAIRHQSLQLPEGHRWIAACGVGDYLYVLEGGRLPVVWRFALPSKPFQKLGISELDVRGTTPKDTPKRSKPSSENKRHGVASEASRRTRHFRGVPPISLRTAELAALPAVS